MAFQGYSQDALSFLTELGSKDKDWFDANKKTYQASIVAPTKAFVADLGERLSETISPHIVALPKTNGSISPINNDLRFSPDRSPYKDHLLLKFWRETTRRPHPPYGFGSANPTSGLPPGVRSKIWVGGEN